jgi:hypothetical protein
MFGASSPFMPSLSALLSAPQPTKRHAEFSLPWPATHIPGYPRATQIPPALSITRPASYHQRTGSSRPRRVERSKSLRQAFTLIVKMAETRDPSLAHVENVDPWSLVNWRTFRSFRFLLRATRSASVINHYSYLSQSFLISIEFSAPAFTFSSPPSSCPQWPSTPPPN